MPDNIEILLPELRRIADALDEQNELLATIALAVTDKDAPVVSDNAPHTRPAAAQAKSPVQRKSAAHTGKSGKPVGVGALPPPAGNMGLDWEPINPDKGIGWSAVVCADGMDTRLLVKYGGAGRKGKPYYGCCYGDGGLLTDVGWHNGDDAGAVAQGLITALRLIYGAVTAL